MHTTITEKIPSGKLVRIKVDFDTTIKKLQITGDFFLHPEDSIEKIEKSIKDTSITTDQQQFKEKIDAVLNKLNAQLIGVTSDDLARLIKQAVTSK